MSNEVEGVMGWCSPAVDGSRPFHNLCRVSYRTQFGVTRRCSCDCHTQTDEEAA